VCLSLDLCVGLDMKVSVCCVSDPEGLSVCLVKTCVFSVGLIIMVSAVITVHLMEKLNKNK